MPVKLISELKENEAFAVICGVSNKYRKEIKQSLERFIHFNWIDINLRDIARLEYLEECYDGAR